MRSWKDIDFTKVDFITYAVDQYLNDIPVYPLISHYLPLYRVDSCIHHGEFDDKKVVVNDRNNSCYVDGELVSAEEFVQLMEGEVDTVPIIKKITDIDLNDYISEVTYCDGTTEYLDVKGKSELIGGWRTAKNDRQ